MKGSTKLPNIFQRLYSSKTGQRRRSRSSQRSSAGSASDLLPPSRLSLTPPSRSYSARSASSRRGSRSGKKRRISKRDVKNLLVTSTQHKLPTHNPKRDSRRKTTKKKLTRRKPKEHKRSSHKPLRQRKKSRKRANSHRPSNVMTKRMKLIAAILTPKIYREKKFDCYYSVAKIIREFCPSILLRRIKNREANGFQHGISDLLLHPRKNVMFFSALNGVYMCLPDDPADITRIGSEEFDKVKCIAWDFKLNTIIVAERTKIKSTSGRVLAKGFSNILDLSTGRNGEIVLADGKRLVSLRPREMLWASDSPIVAVQVVNSTCLFLAQAHDILRLDLSSNGGATTQIFSSQSQLSSPLFKNKLIRGLCWYPEEGFLLCNCGICMLRINVKDGFVEVLKQNDTRRVLGHRIKRKKHSFFVWSWAIHEFMIL